MGTVSKRSVYIFSIKHTCNFHAHSKHHIQAHPRFLCALPAPDLKISWLRSKAPEYERARFQGEINHIRLPALFSAVRDYLLVQPYFELETIGREAKQVGALRNAERIRKPPDGLVR
jgi:hypothetical protein